MIKITKYLIVLLFTANCVTSMAQTHFYLDGYGRAIVSNEKLLGDIVEADTTQTANKSTGGYTLFDLGMNLEKDEKFKINAILRATNQFGRFWGDGVDFEFRQLRMEGVIADGIKYELGDIDVKMTPYTLFNSDIYYNEFESDLFRVRRNIVEYENFNNGNHWRLQGVQSFATLLFDNVVESIDFKAFATRTQAVNDLNQPDQILAGFNTTINQSDYLKLGLNYVGLQDLVISNSIQEYKNDVFTATYDGQFDVGNDFKIEPHIEAGISDFGYSEIDDDTSNTTNDFFWDARVNANYKPFNARITAGYKNVGPQFTSPGAQSRRINHRQTTQVFDETFVGNRNQLMYDRVTQENVYNRNISQVMMGYNPMFNNVLPYGEATPNRNGLVTGLSLGGGKDQFYQIEGKLYALQEIEAMDVAADGAQRSFTKLQGGARLFINQLIGFDNNIMVSGSYSSETTTRDGLAPVDLSSSMVDVALSFEPLNKLDLQFGAKMFTATGNEYYLLPDKYNQFNGTVDPLNFDATEMIYTAGFRFRFSEGSALTLSYNMVDFEDNLLGRDNDFVNHGIESTTEEEDDVFNKYKYNQLFITYILQF